MADSVELTSSKLDEKEKERLERKARIVELESKVVSLSTKAEKLEYIADRIEQYSRCKSIIICGQAEGKRENTESFVIETAKEVLDLPVLLEVLLFEVIFLKVELALIFELLWQCTFNTAHALFFNENLFMSLNGIFI